MQDIAPLSVIDEILSEADRRGLSQKALAAASGIQEESLSRLKKRGNGRLDVIGRLADAAGLRITAVPRAEPVSSTRRAGRTPEYPSSAPPANTFREKYRTLVWSNSKADDAVFIRRALLDPQFPVLLDAALEFGIDKLEQEWGALSRDDSPEARRAAPATGRLLKNLRRGYDKITR
jgi:transcriptional regulator with XRE-family HTH domain